VGPDGGGGGRTEDGNGWRGVGGCGRRGGFKREDWKEKSREEEEFEHHVA